MKTKLTAKTLKYYFGRILISQFLKKAISLLLVSNKHNKDIDKQYLVRILSFELSKKLTCLLLGSHKHKKVIKKLCSNVDLVTCSRCGEKFLYHNKINVYEKYTQERADMEREFNKVDLDTSTIKQAPPPVPPEYDFKVI